MELIKLIPPEEENIVAKNKFVAQSLFPIAIRKVKDSNYVILFFAHQENDDSYIFFQIHIVVENRAEAIYLETNYLFADYLQKIDSGDSKVLSYRTLVSLAGAEPSKIYITDFNLSKIKDKRYHQFNAIKIIDQSHAALIEVFIPLPIFVKINLFFTQLNNFSISSLDIFTSKALKSLDSVNLVHIETVKLDATMETASASNSKFLYTTHYTMNCGPLEFRLMHIILSENPEVPREPLDANLFESFYSNDNIINDYFEFTDDEEEGSFLYILYYEYSKITKEYLRTHVLKIKQELAEKTCFVNPSKIFMKKEIE